MSAWSETEVAGAFNPGLQAITADVSITSAAADTDILSFSLPAGSLAVGDTFQFLAYGTLTENDATPGPSPIWKIFIGTNSIATNIAQNTNFGPATKDWHCEGIFTVRSLGVAGTATGYVRSVNENGFFATTNPQHSSISTITIDTTGALTVKLTLRLGDSGASGQSATAKIAVCHQTFNTI